MSAITIFYTKLLTIDNKMIMIPNGTLSNSAITNLSSMEKRRIDLQISVSYDANRAEVKEVLKKVLSGETAILTEEAVDIYVSELADSAVQMGVRAWVKNEDYWPVRWRLLENIKNALDENHISIPYPQLDVTVKEQDKQI